MYDFEEEVEEMSHIISFYLFYALRGCKAKLTLNEVGHSVSIEQHLLIISLGRLVLLSHEKCLPTKQRK